MWLFSSVRIFTSLIDREEARMRHLVGYVELNFFSRRLFNIYHYLLDNSKMIRIVKCGSDVFVGDDHIIDLQ